MPGRLAACGGGRYQKLSRQLPQSAWVVNGTRLGKGSVEEIVGDPIKEVRRTFWAQLVNWKVLKLEALSYERVGE